MGGVQQLHLFQRRGFHLGGRQKPSALISRKRSKPFRKISDLMNVHHVSPSPVQSKNIPATNVALQTKKR
ncbi:hypothetical protein ACFTAO_39200 [Paenibacillus rhizoplanae]